jgi:PST family polysaccharide transporter
MVLLLTVGRMGPLWICAMVGVAFAFRALFFMWYFQRTDGVTISSGLVRLLPIFLACVPMVAAVVGTRMGLLQAGIDRPVVSLILEIIAGGVAYTGCVVLLARDASEDFLGLVRKALRRRLAS